MTGESNNTDKRPSIIYEDSDIMLVEKPANLLSVPGKGPEGQYCVINQLLLHTPEARVIHRLDMATSGLMVFAKTAAAQKHLGLQFEKRQVVKSYLAVVDGKAPVSGSIDLPLIKDWPNRPKQKVCYEQGKSSVTDYQRLSYDVLSDTTRLLLKPKTGRSHQLRVHLMSIGHPIIGDEFYAHEQALQKSPRLLLHAAHLAFIHPGGNMPVSFDSKPEF